MRFSGRSCRTTVLSGCSLLALCLAATSSLPAENGVVVKKKSVVVSASTYDNSQGAIASLAIGTTLAKSKSATTPAVAGNDYVHVWNNASVDGSFGVTSAIQLIDINAADNSILHTINVPSDQVVTSFPSKSEVGLHAVTIGTHSYITFLAYGGAGVGAIDVSNSDAVAGQDPTNPVTHAFGANYAFHRTIVLMDERGHFVYTPTIDYGGNNGRSALLGSNGLYYMVGNANNGDAAAFNTSTRVPNGTDPDVTTTTGLVVVNPINGATSSVAIPANNSAEVDPLIQYVFGSPPKPDKAGKDDNYRGITEFNGSLYFTKGSGSNGYDTIYTVQGLPTVANAAAAVINFLPVFPAATAARTTADFTPFAVFFANDHTMYVTDEASGDATDVAQHGGLQKWSLVNGTWNLDYILTNGLIGTVDKNVTGAAGPWPDITTVGLRNLTGEVNANGTVTLWATTSTSSTSGDNGADPNKVVKITDVLSATTMTTKVSQEKFTTVMGPTYGTVYRGVVFVPGTGADD
jgi:hypothetical protein